MAGRAERGRMGGTGSTGTTARHDGIRAIRAERGLALVIAMAALSLMSTIAAVLILITSSESTIAANYRNSVEALYVADALAEHGMWELTSISDWDVILNELARSSFVDGEAHGVRALPGGGEIDLAAVVARANCGKITCSAADITGNATGDRPWGADNPVWHLFGYGPLSALLPGVISPFYVVVMIADDPSETDGDPAKDGSGEDNPGARIIALRAEAFGPADTHKVLELTVTQCWREAENAQGGQDGEPDRHEGSGPGSVRVLSWREVR